MDNGPYEEEPGLLGILASIKFPSQYSSGDSDA